MRIPRRGLAALLTLAALPARAESWPPANLRLILPYPPGGVGDLTARLLTQHMQEAIPTRIVVDNRGGGATVPGTRAIQAAAPDGTTIGMVDNAFTINPGLMGADLPYDPLRDFSFISHVAAAPMVLVVHPSLGVTDVQSFIALAKQRGDSLAFGSAGNGTPVHIAGELFRRAAGITWTHAPYRGAGPMMTDLVAGTVQVAFATVPTALAQARDGRIRVLAASGRERPALMPDVPSMAEAGLPDVSIRVNLALVGPAALPPEHVNGLSATVKRVLAQQAVQERLRALGLVPVGSTPDELRALFAAEIAQMAAVIKEAGIKPG
ncbi:tripartite tricarboxylate transporter substrate binding protein [Roseomonas sp. AR75]|uniref:Bug family tripartite tricarboxylate transporter substrate binding protein n=1 Tax=Roseomonas sp. AR75 TaxID=2562311 RepID=UPI001484FDB7|nr:tripartite tricarboxylate transporter substrate-binding protein [Roseomonas sp. AR75]